MKNTKSAYVSAGLLCPLALLILQLQEVFKFSLPWPMNSITGIAPVLAALCAACIRDQNSPMPHVEGTSAVKQHAQQMLNWLRRVERLIVPTVISVGGGGLIGWGLHIDSLKSVVPGLAPMKPNSALALILCGISLWVLQSEEKKARWRSYLQTSTAMAALLIGLLTLIEYLFRCSLHIDELIFKETRANVHFPGRMSPQAAVCITLSALALLAFCVKSAKVQRFSHWLASASALLSFVAIMGYAYSISVFYKIQSYTGMALHTAVILLMLNVGIICARPLSGFWAAWARSNPGSVMLRRALPGAIIGAFVLGWIRLEAQRLGLLNLETGVAMLATSASMVFVITVAWAAKSANKAVEMVSEHFRLVLEASSTGMLLVDQSLYIVLVNAQAEQQFGCSREELIGQAIENFIPDIFCSLYPAKPSMSCGRDVYGHRKDGTEVPMEVTARSMETVQGKFVLCSVVDISQRKRAEQERAQFVEKLQSFNAELEERVHDRTAELSRTLKEREVLLQEIHHRVKNNLQVISSLINLKIRGVSDSSSRAALEECRARVVAIALIHEMLYQSNDYASVPFTDYMHKLAGDVFHMSRTESARVTMNLSRIEQVRLPVDKAVPCGLILSELITNSLKHAFPNDRQGTIRVEIRNLEDGRIELSVIDDGVGIPGNSGAGRPKSLGMHLVRTLANQLGSELAICSEPGQGTCFRVAFAVEDEKTPEPALAATH